MGPISSVRRRRRCLALFISLAIVFYLRVTVKVHNKNSQLGEWRRELERGKLVVPEINGRNSVRAISSEESQHRQQRQYYVHPAMSDTIIKYLTKLAELPPAQLWNVLGMDDDEMQYGDDPFSLRQLDNGTCPWETETSVPWLPQRPFNSETIAEIYRKNRKSVKEEDNKEETEVAIWYEHLSKAGGTTFCALAESNMMRWQVPRYHCMPRKGKLLDGRVGSWSNEELAEHILVEGHAIVSNEWDPFSFEKLEMSGRQLDGTSTQTNLPSGPKLLFLTTLRDPSDRLLSAYIFFAITVKTANKDDDEFEAQSFNEWRKIMLRGIQNYQIGSTAKGFRTNMARSNHIVWRFSGGSLPHAYPVGENEWKPSFLKSIQSLSQFDLILPMDVMTKEWGKSAMHELLGWEEIQVKGGRKNVGDEKSSVVTVGQRQNSNARDYFPKDDYQDLWEENWLDNILYLWCRAVFLARLHCKDVIV